MTDFGKDVLCLDSPKTGRYATGATLIGQRLYHALITPRGNLLGGADEESFGEDLSELVGAPANKDTSRKIRAKVQRAASKDDAIESVDVDIVESVQSNGATSYAITIVANTSAGPFSLVLSVDDVSVELVGLS